MRKEISYFYLGKQLSGSYTIEQGIVTVSSWDGRTKKTEVGGSAGNPEHVVRQMLIELETEKDR